MSDKNLAPKAPKAIVEQLESAVKGEPRVDGDAADGAFAAGEGAPSRDRAEADASQTGEGASGAGNGPARGFQRTTIGFFENMGHAVWAYADAHPHATLYGIIGFVLAVLILVIGLWDTLVIAVFVFVGTVIGQMADGDNAAVNFIRRFIDGRK